MSTTLESNWRAVQATLADAKGIAFDGCHKIYILMDDAQMTEMREYGYGEDETDFLVHLNTDEDRKAALTTLQAWYDESCGLRFVNAVATVKGDPNEGFTSLISQFEDEPEEPGEWD